ncbi:hypothetical protein ACYZT9_08175 [Pseudomonas sp. ZT5P21]
MEGQSLLVPFRRLEKGLAVRAKPPAAVAAATDMYPIASRQPPAAVTVEPDTNNHEVRSAIRPPSIVSSEQRYALRVFFSLAKLPENVFQMVRTVNFGGVVAQPIERACD